MAHLFGVQKLGDFSHCKKRVIMTKSGYRSHTEVLIKRLFLLKIDDLCALYDCIFCYKYENQLLPDYLLISLSDDYFHEYLTRARGNRRVPAVRHEFARQSISYRFPINFNGQTLYSLHI